MSVVRIQKVTFKKMEAEWYNYHQTVKEIAVLREEIMNPYNEEVNENSGGSSSGSVSSPTERIATRLTTNKQLKYLNEVATAIEQVYNALPENYKQLVRCRYWSKRKRQWESIAHECNVSVRQAQRWRDEIVQATIEELGWR